MQFVGFPVQVAQLGSQTKHAPRAFNWPGGAQLVQTGLPCGFALQALHPWGHLGHVAFTKKFPGVQVVQLIVPLMAVQFPHPTGHCCCE